MERKVIIRLPEELVPAIQEAATEAEVTASRWLRRAIEAALRAEGRRIPRIPDDPKEDP